jgi:hypothetical protein
MNEYELLTPEEKKYLERIARYLQSMGEKQVEIRIEANDWDNKTEISDIEWEHVTHFDWNSRLDIPSGFITILQKIFNYIDESGRYSFPDIDGINYHDFLIDINAAGKSITVSQIYGYYDVGSEGEIEFEDEKELMVEWMDQLESNGAEIPSDGILTARYSGGGDDGSIDGGFDEINQQLPGSMEDFCYNQLSSNYGGWENNEGGQGYFVFNFTDGTITLYHTDNIEESESNTLFEIDF